MEYINYTYAGTTYKIAIGEPDKAKVDQYYQQNLKGSSFIYSGTGGAKTRGIAERKFKMQLMAAAYRLERQERLKAKVDEFFRKNKHVIKEQPDGSPQSTSAQTPIRKGEPGISRRRTELPPILKGADKTIKTPAAENPVVVTDEDARKQVSTLADELNRSVTRKLRAGFVNKSMEPDELLVDHRAQVADLAMISAGLGHREGQLQKLFTGIDRFSRSFMPKNVELTGYTFMTRPRLNLSTANISTDPLFAAMLTDRYSDVAFAIRCMLDTQFCKDNPLEVDSCPLIDKHNPFAVLLSNAITGIGGFNDVIVSTETTEDGYFQENMTYAIGGEKLDKTYELTPTFRDYPGSPVAATFDFWVKYLTNLYEGRMIQYADAIDANRLDYTVSIYRFIVDRANRHITRWAKATGCFPVTSPVGVPFNYGQGERIVAGTDNFTINFKANRLEYNNPVILREFNMLVRRYNPTTITRKNPQLKAFAYAAQNNYEGIPYVTIGDYGYELSFINHDTNVPLTDNSSSKFLPNGTI